MSRLYTRKDGGWGWVIVIAAFTLNFLTDGVRYSFGIMLVEWHDEFEGGMAEISWVASLMFGLILIAAPLSGALINKYGCRAVAIAGTLTTFTGFISSVFAKTILQLYFTFGFLGGIGFSMMFITGYVVIIQYFEKRRSLAIGLAVLGSGSGGLVFNPFSKWLLEQYGWRGTLLIESGILLNGIACGAVMRPVKSSEDVKQGKHNEDVMKPILNETDVDVNRDTDVAEVSANKRRLDDHTEQQLLGLANREPRTFNMPVEHQNTDGIKKANRPIPLGTTTENRKSCIKNSILNIFRFDLLLKKRFLLFAIVEIFINISYMVPFIYIFDMALEMRHSSDKAVWLMTSMSIANVASRIPVGIVADLPRVNTLYMMAVLCVFAGIFTGVMPLCQMYELLLLACIMYSVCIGMVLIPVVLSNLFGNDVIADAFGLSLLFGGLAGMIGPSLTGALFDWTQSYYTAFITAGIEFVIGGLVLCLIPCVGTANINA